MATIDVDLIEESETRYLTYALSVVSSRALPDVRDGLKPVQRRILYAMYRNLRLLPDKAHRKSAAVVGEVLARYHPHGDSACYEAMVRMAQDFSLRYPLVDGQGNFGSLDGDSAAAYRYTEAKLTQLALEVLGDIEQQTVAERDNFDQTVKEPVVLPARVPNLLINGASGIAVGMATAIPPHNLKEVVDALLMLLENSEAKDAQLIGKIKGPDFPTGCSILNTVSELREIYTSGRGAIRMRADYGLEKGQRGKNFIVISSVPYGVDKSAIVEKIADLIIAKKIPQLTDVRDESTEIVRVVLELAPEANAEIAMAYLYKHTPLEHSFHVNLTALVPTSNPLSGRPTRLSLREMLQQFLDFRLKVTRAKLEYEKAELEKRIHLLEGLALVLPSIEEVIKIVRKSDGRADSAAKLQKRFTLSELQAFYIVDLRIYQLSKTNIDEVLGELKEKQDRVKAINKLLKSEAALKGEIAADLKRVSDSYGDKRRSKILHEFEEVTIDAQQFVQHEDVYALVTKDGWLKRIRQNNDPAGTRLREGDSLMFAQACSTRDFLALFSSAGNVYVGRVTELSSTSGYGEPVQKLYKFADGESIVGCLVVKAESTDMFDKDREIVLLTRRGFGFRLKQSFLEETKKNGRRLVRVSAGDALVGVCEMKGKLLAIISREGYGVQLQLKDVPLLAQAGKGVTLQKLPANDPVVGFVCGGKDQKFAVEFEKGGTRDLTIGDVVESARARRGNKVIQRGGPLARIVVV